MKRNTLYKVTLLAILMLIISWVPASAQDNLLTNPGFEGDYVSYDGIAPRMVAQGWTPWHVPRTADMPSYQNIQPKYEATAPDATRIRSGSNAQHYYSFFEAHDGGVYQRVTGITAGTELRFSVYVYVWSSTFNDVDLSEDPGNVFVQVGIDPTGGTDGESDNIVWSTPVEQYDTYREYSVIATASNTAVTVFVRSQVAGFPVQHSDIYLDDAVLAQTTGGSQPQPTNTSTATATNTTAAQPQATNTSTATVTNTTAAQPQATNTTTATNTTAAQPQPTNTSTATAADQPTDEPTPTSEDAGPPSPTPITSLPTATNIPSGGTGSGDPLSDTFPGQIVHTVRRGDTVGALAQLYGSSIQAIIAANGLDESALIFAGQGLIIPVRIPNPATETPTNTPVVLVVTATPVPNGSGGGIGGAQNVYIVQPGDTLFRIASRYNTTVATLAQMNGIVNANLIFIGQRITLPIPTSPPPATGGATLVPTSPSQQPTPVPPPPPATYLVQPGDTLYRISLRLGVPLRPLAEINGITNYNRIFIGQVLVLP